MKLPKFNIYNLLVFYCVAKERSISAAANNLCLTQPAVTHHIRYLEKNTGVKLIKLSKQKITLTPVGEGLYQHARDIYQHSMAAERFIEVMKETDLNIGITPIFGPMMTNILETLFCEMCPRLKFNIKMKESPILIDELLNSTIDLAIVDALPKHRVHELNYVPLVKDIKLVFYASPGNPIFKKDRIEWRDLTEYPLITQSDDSLVNQLVNEKLKQEGLEIGIHGPHIMNSPELNKRLVIKGDYIGATYVKSIEEHVESGKLRLLSLPDDITFDVTLVFYSSTFLSSTAQKLLLLVKEAFAPFVDNH
jgi:LysR family transcriptional regulator, transcriptional activator of the cysJI operon